MRAESESIYLGHQNSIITIIAGLQKMRFYVLIPLLLFIFYNETRLDLHISYNPDIIDFLLGYVKVNLRG